MNKSASYPINGFLCPDCVLRCLYEKVNRRIISALIMAVVAIAQIYNGQSITAIAFFASAVCEVSLAAIYRKRDKKDKT